ncbi:ATP-binding cassette domain-containing protein [Erwiniaceae bacterium CMYE1]|nr:ATP-binding cassette domain-containing protein [Erwinia phyllosphaerae]MBV4366076.1 ATP-binding cassette domain-containing protein [Erwinia phyllosphaerae]
MINMVNLEAGYQGRAVTPLLNGVFHQGSMTALVGANGCGKSTFLKTLAGLLPPVAGHITPARSQLDMAWLPQQSEIEKNFPLSVFDLVAMGCWRQCGWFGGITRQMRQKIIAALHQVNMQDFATAQPATLSGGQLQRVLFARLLVQDASLLLLDEPFTGIDTATTELLLALLTARHRAGCTMIVVLHDKTMVERFFPQTLRFTTDCAEWSENNPQIMKRESA